MIGLLASLRRMLLLFCCSILLTGCSRAEKVLNFPTSESIIRLECHITSAESTGSKEEFVRITDEAKISQILNFLVPNRLADGGKSNNPYQIVCRIRIILAGEESILIEVRDVGKNPCMITIDGANFYWGNDSDIQSIPPMRLVAMLRSFATKS
jgi:hypothetical protein